MIIEPGKMLDMTAAAKLAAELRGERHTLREESVVAWATRGLRGVKLDSICVGSRRLTTKDALLQFFVAVAQASTPRPKFKHKATEAAASNT